MPYTLITVVTPSEPTGASFEAVRSATPRPIRRRPQHRLTPTPTLWAVGGAPTLPVRRLYALLLLTDYRQAGNRCQRLAWPDGSRRTAWPRGDEAARYERELGAREPTDSLELVQEVTLREVHAVCHRAELGEQRLGRSVVSGDVHNHRWGTRPRTTFQETAQILTSERLLLHGESPRASTTRIEALPPEPQRLTVRHHPRERMRLLPMLLRRSIQPYWRDHGNPSYAWRRASSPLPAS